MMNIGLGLQGCDHGNHIPRDPWRWSAVSRSHMSMPTLTHAPSYQEQGSVDGRAAPLLSLLALMDGA